jgi:cysteine synthase
VRPVLEEHAGIGVVRDDLFPGGTKARFIPQLFDGADEVVYATPAQGGAQYALAVIARQLGKRVTLFVAERKEQHPRQHEAKALGAKVVLVSFGMLSNVQAKAKAYAADVGARLAPFGMDLPEAIDVIAGAARSLDETPDEVWCSAGSGTLCRSLIKAWPKAHHVAVAVGRNIPPKDVSIEGVTAELIRYPKPFEAHARTAAPFPSDPHYDAKAWEIATARKQAGRRIIFWNVVGPAVA